MKVIQSNKIEGAWIIPQCIGCGGIHYIRTQPEANQHTWSFNGNEEKPTFSPSFKSMGAILCHFFIKDGKVEFCSDSSHIMAGKTVELLDIDEESSFYYHLINGEY